MSMSSVSELMLRPSQALTASDAFRQRTRRLQRHFQHIARKHGGEHLDEEDCKRDVKSQRVSAGPCVECVLDRPSCSRRSKTGCRNSRVACRKQQGYGMRLEIMVAYGCHILRYAGAIEEKLVIPCHTMLYSTSHSIEAVSRVSGMDDQNLSKRLQVNLLVKPEDCSHITSHVTST